MDNRDQNKQSEESSSCSFFSGISSEDIRRYCPNAQVIHITEMSSLYNQGDPCNHVFFIISGQVKLARVDTRGREFTVGFLTAGECFGSCLANIESCRTNETATVKDEATVWKLNIDEFRSLLSAHPELSLRLIEMLTRRQRQLEDRLESFALKGTEARLAKTLHELSGGFNNRCEHGFKMHIHLTQQELADLVGASRPVISTILNKLRNEDVLTYNRDYLCVRSIEEIEKLIEK